MANIHSFATSYSEARDKFLAAARVAGATTYRYENPGKGPKGEALSTDVARLLSGKHKPQWAPHVDTGDFVIVVNAEKVILTGKKEDDKVYRRPSGFMGGLRETAAGKMRQKHPTRLIEEAVKGMLPKTKLGRAMFGKLKVYAGPDHPHRAQKPLPLQVKKK